jgi:dihydroneopterin aldolase
MPMTARVELSGLEIAADIGTYGAGDVVPRAHLLDLALTIGPDLVVIPQDGMAHVFDYDPLVRRIDALARDGHYETQERLLIRIVEACAAHGEILAVDAKLSKTPVLGETGHLGVRIALDAAALAAFRTRVE